MTVEATPEHRIPPGLAAPGFEFLARAALIGTALYAFSAGMRVYQGAGIWPPSVPMGLFLYIAGASLFLAAFLIREPRDRRVIGLIGIVIMTSLVASLWYEIEFANPAYGTDAIALSHIGADVLIDGSNPYEVEGSPLLDQVTRFGVADSFVTRTLSGTATDRLISYPGGHVLTYATGVVLGLRDLRWVTVLFEIAALVLIWWVISPVGRLVVPFAFLVEENLPLFFTSGGVTDWPWVLPLVAAAVFLSQERFGYAGIALGVACAMKQQAWFVLPFVLIWVYQKLRDRAPATRKDGLSGFGTGAAAGFLVLNLPFMVWSFGDWLSGVLHPALGEFVPDGQGFSILASRGVLPISGTSLTVALILVTAISIYAYYRWFDRLQDLLWVLPAALFLFSSRSFHSYFIYWAPIALVWLDLRINQHGDPARTTERAAPASLSRAVGLSVIALIVAAGATVVASKGTTVELGAIEPTVTRGMVSSLGVEVINNSDHELVPVFDVYWGGWELPWVAVGNASVGADKTATIQIVPVGPDGVPPSRIDSDGQLRVAPFRVRVNESGESTYVSSDIVSVPLAVAVVNPDFEQWRREGSPLVAPLGWLPSRFGGGSAQLALEPGERERGLEMQVESDGVGPADWIEVALLQEVVSVQPCYRWDFSHTLDYRTDQNGSPLAAAGVQIIQGDSQLWFVPSTGTSETSTILGDGTVVVEIPAESGEPTSAILDLRPYAESARTVLGRPGAVKIFNALHKTIAAQSHISSSSFDAVACS